MNFELFFIAVLIIYSDEGAAEGQDLAEGDEYAMVDLRQRWAAEARYQKQNSKRA